MTADAAFWDQIAEKYARDPIKDMRSFRYTLERTRSYLNTSSRVLEVGCGTGTSALLLANSARRIAACDASEAMIRIAQRKLQNSDAPRNVTFEVAPLSAAHLPLGTFDVVTAFNVLHLVRDLDEALAAIAQRVRPGGFFISKTACLADSSLLLLKPILPVMERMGKAPHVSFLKRSFLQARIRAQGFRLIEVGDFPRRPPRHFIVARRLD